MEVFFVGSLNNPSPKWIAQLNPLDIIAYGLFFSTGIDLAYMLFTPGPDETLEPVMTGLAAAILLGLGKLDLSQAPVEHGIVLFLAAAALAGLFATRKFLFHPDEKQNNTMQDEVAD